MDELSKHSATAQTCKMLQIEINIMCRVILNLLDGIIMVIFYMVHCSVVLYLQSYLIYKNH